METCGHSRLRSAAYHRSDGGCRGRYQARVAQISRSLTVLGFGLATFACSSGSDDTPKGAPHDAAPANAATEQIDYEKLCKLFVSDCKLSGTLTLPECVSSYRASRFSAACVDEVAAMAGCADFDEAFLNACFPSCSVPGALCNGDGTVTQCRENKRQYTVDCQRSCAARSQTWTGECGGGATGHEGQTSDEDKCWCTG